MEDLLYRTRMLLKDELTDKLVNSSICVVGLGGVGGEAFECLVRSGVKRIIIIDYDVVNISNLNRQTLYKQEDLGVLKTNASLEFAKSINSEVEILIINEFVDCETLKKLDEYHIDFLIDAIDSMKAKCELIKYCIKRKLKFVSSLGMANRIDPSKVQIMRLDKTYNCPFAKKLRLELKQLQVNLKDVMCVFSHELPLVHNKVPASMMMVPATAGLNAVSYLIQLLINKEI